MKKSEITTLDVSADDLYVCLKAYIIKNYHPHTLEIFNDIIGNHTNWTESDYPMLYEAAAKAMFNEFVNTSLKNYITENQLK